MSAEPSDNAGHQETLEVAQVSALVFQSDDVAEDETSKGIQEQQEQETKKTRLPKMFLKAKARSSEVPRPSVATEVATFNDVFGVLGIPTVIVLLLSAAWTFMLAVIQVHADTVANTIMNTTELDNGEFWLLPQPDASIVISSTVLLSLFGIGYTGLALTMLFFNRVGGLHKTKDTQTETTTDTNAVIRAEQATTHVVAEGDAAEKNKLQRFIAWVHHKIDLPIEIRHNYITAALDLPKLVFQTITLFTYLRGGFPLGIIYYYSILLLCNWLVGCYRSQRYVADPDLIIARLYYTYVLLLRLELVDVLRLTYLVYVQPYKIGSFDLFFAVFAPLVVLIYFIESFHFDRAEFMTKLETIGPGSFDTVARIFGDPSQIASFCNAFHYLQFSSGKSLFYKSALNALSLYKWRKIILTLIHNHQEREMLRKRKASVEPDSNKIPSTRSLKSAIAKKIAAAATSKHKVGKYFVAKLFLSLVFFVAGVLIFVYSIGSVRSSTDLCNKYEKCALTSYQWNFGQKHCTCLVFADRLTAPKTFAEWTDPVDTTDNLAELATAGELRIVQIINRAVPELPEQLRECHDLEQLILAYTKIERLPEWFSEFSYLQYFFSDLSFIVMT